MHSNLGMIGRTCSLIGVFGIISLELANAQTTPGPSISSSAAMTSSAQVDFVGAAPLPVPLASTYSDAQAVKTITNALTAAAPSFSLKLPGSSTGYVGSGN